MVFVRRVRLKEGFKPEEAKSEANEIGPAKVIANDSNIASDACKDKSSWLMLTMILLRVYAIFYTTQQNEDYDRHYGSFSELQDKDSHAFVF